MYQLVKVKKTLSDMAKLTLHFNNGNGKGFSFPFVVAILALITFYRASKSSIIILATIYYWLNNQPRVNLSKD